MGIKGLLLGIILWVGGMDHLPEKPKAMLNDYAGVLSSGGQNAIEEKLRNHEKKTTQELAVAIIPNLGGADIFSYSQALFDLWKIGKKEVDNGALLVISLEDRKIRIHTGRGIQPYVTAKEAGRIISDIMAPQMKVKNYDSAISKGVDAILMEMSGSSERGEKPQSAPWLALIGLIFFIVIFLIAAFRNRPPGGGKRGRGYSIGNGGLFFWGPGWSGGGGFGGGGGGGSFGGFGGGDSGGGGASGGW